MSKELAPLLAGRDPTQAYQHEILLRAHDPMGHQGIGKVVARIQERHTWPGIRRTVGRVREPVSHVPARSRQTWGRSVPSQKYSKRIL